MILLRGFTTGGNFPCRYELDESDALRLAQLVGHPVRPGVTIEAHVTIYHEGLTNDAIDENFKRARDDSDAFAETGDLFDRSGE